MIVTEKITRITTQLENEDGDRLTVVTTMDCWVSSHGCCRVYAHRDDADAATGTQVLVDMPINGVLRGKPIPFERLHRLERHRILVRAAIRFLGSDHRRKPGATIRVEECDYIATIAEIVGRERT